MEVWRVADYVLFLYILVAFFLKHTEFGRRKNLPADTMLDIGLFAFVLLTLLRELSG